MFSCVFRPVAPEPEMKCLGCNALTWDQHGSSCPFYVAAQSCNCIDHQREVKYRGFYWSYELRNEKQNVPNPYQSEYESILYEIAHNQNHIYRPATTFQHQKLNCVHPVHTFDD